MLSTMMFAKSEGLQVDASRLQEKKCCRAELHGVRGVESSPRLRLCDKGSLMTLFLSETEHRGSKAQPQSLRHRKQRAEGALDHA